MRFPSLAIYNIKVSINYKQA